MTKTITIQSKRIFLYDTKEQIAFGRYKYCPASSAVKVFTKAVAMFNDGLDQELALEIVIKYTDQEDAKIKLKGKKQSIITFVNRVFAETELLDNFDVKC